MKWFIKISKSIFSHFEFFVLSSTINIELQKNCIDNVNIDTNLSIDFLLVLII